jgi:hypothetical protein
MPRSSIKSYMVDCYYPDQNCFDGFRKEAFHVKALSDDGAISEAKLHAPFRNGPHHFHVRISMRKGSVIVYKSEDDPSA